jgi:ribosomal protein S18 acetylase RimI-like enzyme
VNIRPASIADLEGILDCMREAFAPYRRAYTTAAYDDTVPSIEAMEERLRTMNVLIAVDAHGEVIGTIASSVVAPGEGHLRGMAVRPSWQGRGVAPALMAAAESPLQGAGCTRVTLDTTRVLERAMAFYQSVGYRRTGRISDFFGMELIEYAKDLTQR